MVIFDGALTYHIEKYKRSVVCVYDILTTLFFSGYPNLKCFAYYKKDDAAQ